MSNFQPIIIFAADCKGLPHEEKNKLASEKWKGQTDEQKSKFVDCAKAHKQLNTRVSELTQKQKRKLIDEHRKKLLEEVIHNLLFYSYTWL